MKDDTQNVGFSDAFTTSKLVLGENIRFHRKKFGYSQEELGHKIGADQAYVSRLESGKFNPTLESLVELSVVLNVKMRDLFDEIEMNKCSF